MNLRHIFKIAGALASLFAALSVSSCVTVDNELGSSLIPLSSKYDLYTLEIPLEDISMKQVDGLSGYSNSRMTIGSVRDAQFGLTTRACALTLVPVFDSVEVGKNPIFKSFHFTAEHDTTSFASRKEERILQNINVYELEKPMDFQLEDLKQKVKHKNTRITDGIPVYNGVDSLSFNFSKAYGEKYLTMTLDDLKDMDTYLKKFPGIYIETDEPEGLGGRINMFGLQLGVNQSEGYVSKNYAVLQFSAEYEGERKDSSILFYFSPNKMYNLDSLLMYKSQYSSYKFPQYCFNSVGHETESLQGKVTESAHVEGGAGLKPVISSEEIYNKLYAEISKHGDPAAAVINKASIVMPFEFPEDYNDIYLYPDYLNPTLRRTTDDGVTFASLSNTSSTSTEDPGARNRHTLQYAPDITYHVQKILSIKKDEKFSDYDVWLLPMSVEYTVEENTSSSSTSDYYNYLSYMNYMNNLYGYGYGGYGDMYGYGGMYGYGDMYGYGGYYDPYGYGYGYNNYYSYAMMSQMYGSSSDSSTSSSVELDKDRFFNVPLNGPQSKTGRTPVFKVIYALPKK